MDWDAIEQVTQRRDLNSSLHPWPAFKRGDNVHHVDFIHGNRMPYRYHAEPEFEIVEAMSLKTVLVAVVLTGLMIGCGGWLVVHFGLSVVDVVLAVVWLGFFTCLALG